MILEEPNNRPNESGRDYRRKWYRSILSDRMVGLPGFEIDSRFEREHGYRMAQSTGCRMSELRDELLVEGLGIPYDESVEIDEKYVQVYRIVEVDDEYRRTYWKRRSFSLLTFNGADFCDLLGVDVDPATLTIERVREFEQALQAAMWDRFDDPMVDVFRDTMTEFFGDDPAVAA